MAVREPLLGASNDYDVRNDPSLMWMVLSALAVTFIVLITIGVMSTSTAATPGAQAGASGYSVALERQVVSY